MIASYRICKSHSVHCVSCRMKRKKDESCPHASSLEGTDYRIYSNIDAVDKIPSELESKENRLYSNVDDINISLSGIYLNSPMRKVTL